MSTFDRDQLEELDRNDQLAAFREEFLLRDGLIYLDGNSLGAMPKVTSERVHHVIENEWAQGLINSWLGADWINAPTRVGAKIANLLGAHPGEVVVADSTSINLFKAIAAALSANPGRKTILSETGNFPTDLYIMQGLEKFAPEKITYSAVAPETVLDNLDDSVAVLVLTQVHYKTALIRDMKEITRRAQEVGALVVWDLSHSAGSIEIDLNAANVDFAVGCGYKFLNGGPGAPAFIFAASRHHASVEPILSGWFGHKDPFLFTDDYAPASDAKRFLCGTTPVLAISALECGVDIFSRADMFAVREKAKRLGSVLIDLMKPLCAEHGFKLISPQDDELRGGHVSYQHERSYEILQALKRQDVIGDFRAPDVLRLGITPLYLRYIDIWYAVEKLTSIMTSSEWRDPAFSERAIVT